MSTRKLLVLTGVFVALLAFVVFYERFQPTSEEREKARKRLLDFKAEDVTALTVERKDLPKIVLTRRGERLWSLAGPPAYPADPAVVDPLLGDLGRLDVEGEARTSFDPKETGLDAPRAKATLTFKNGTTKTVAFGKDVPGLDAVAASDGARFAAVRSAPLPALAKPVDDFRSKALLEVPVGEITEMTLVRATQKVVLARDPGKDGKPAGPWRVEAPIKDLADQTFTDQFLTDVAAVRVSTFANVPAADLPKVGLAPPVVALTLRRRDEIASALAFGAAPADAAGKVYVRRDDAVLVVDDRLQDDLSKELSAFREPKLLPIEPWSTARISFESPAIRAGAERVEGQWRTAGKSVAASAAEDLLDRLSRIEARGFVAPRDYAARGIPVPRGKGKGPEPLATVEILRSGDATPSVVRFFPAAPSGAATLVAAEVTGRSEAVLVDAGSFQELPKLAEKLKHAASAAPTVPAAPAPAAKAPASPK